MDLTCGHLFRPTTPDLGIKDAHFTSSAAESRLKGCLREMNADDGETLYGFRSGCAITLAFTGTDLAEIMDHVGWTRRHTALYYMQLAKVLGPTGASARLASNIGTEPSCSCQDDNQTETVCVCIPCSQRREEILLTETVCVCIPCSQRREEILRRKCCGLVVNIVERQLYFLPTISFFKH